MRPNQHHPHNLPNVPNQQVEKPANVFHARISNVRARLRVVEPRPVVLSFDFDNYGRAETDVYARGVNPEWRFDTSSIRGLDGRRPSAASAAGSGLSPAGSGQGRARSRTQSRSGSQSRSRGRNASPSNAPR